MTLLFIIISTATIAEDNHWAQPQVNYLIENYKVEEVFESIEYDKPIKTDHFQYLIKELIDKDYDSSLDNNTREAVIHELMKLWADKTGKDLENLIVPNMFIYSDRAKIKGKYRKAIISAYRQDIAKGRDSGIFAPKKKVNYGELAVLMINTKRAIKQPEFIKGKTISSRKVEEIIRSRSEKVMEAVAAKNFENLAEYIHPNKGVRFTPYTNVSIKEDVIFSKEKVKDFLQDNNKYLWGYYDGSGKEIRLTPREYYEEFIYSKDFIKTKKVGYNEVLTEGNMIENQFDVYNNPIIVEYYLPGDDKKYSGMDWRSLRLVFEKYKRQWMLTGIIHNQWTI